MMTDSSNERANQWTNPTKKIEKEKKLSGITLHHNWLATNDISFYKDIPIVTAKLCIYTHSGRKI